jgi:hypothetical protein
MAKNKVRYTGWIDSYVENELDETGRKDFEAELSINRDLALEYQLEKDMEKTLSQEDLLDLRSKCIIAQDELNHSNKEFGNKMSDMYMIRKKDRYKNST